MPSDVDAVKQNAEAMAELFVMAFKKIYRKFENFDKYATAEALDKFMSWVKRQKETDDVKLVTWYGDRYNELYAQRARLLKKDPEGKEELMDVWVLRYEDTLQRLNVGDAKNEGLQEYVARCLEIQQRKDKLCDSCRDMQKGRPRPEIVFFHPERLGISDAKQHQVPLCVPKLNFHLIPSTTLADEPMDVGAVKQNAEAMAAMFVKMYPELFVDSKPTIEHFNALSKNPSEINTSLQFWVAQGMFFNGFVFALYYAASYDYLLENSKTFCHPAGSLPETSEYLIHVWNTHYERALAEGRASLIEKGIFDAEPAPTVQLIL